MKKKPFCEDDMIEVKTRTGSYPVYLEKGALSRVGERFDLDRRVMVVTDGGVPRRYAETVLGAAREGRLFIAPQGEGAKSLPVYEAILKEMLNAEFDRHDCVVAVGGGVVGDLAGFVAASYMRGVDFYNIPTTSLSQVDSSIGGKVAVNLEGVKNAVGAFYPPRAVLIDPDVLQTLSPRLFACGMAEAIKMAACFDRALFDRFAARREDPAGLIGGALLIKKRVVEEDETEKGLRRVLNFGHTLAHALETEQGLNGLYHGECVAIGMLPFCGDSARGELEAVLTAYGLPTRAEWKTDRVLADVRHDKKKRGDRVTVVTVPRIGEFEFRDLSEAELRAVLEREETR